MPEDGGRNALRERANRAFRRIGLAFSRRHVFGDLGD